MRFAVIVLKNPMAIVIIVIAVRDAVIALKMMTLKRNQRLKSN
jgi:hypothetical protein